MHLLTIKAVCVDCGNTPPAGCAHLKFKLGSRWECAVCGSPAVNNAGLLTVLWASFSMGCGVLWFEIYTSRSLSRYRPVQWFWRFWDA